MIKLTKEEIEILKALKLLGKTHLNRVLCSGTLVAYGNVYDSRHEEVYDNFYLSDNLSLLFPFIQWSENGVSINKLLKGVK